MLKSETLLLFERRSRTRATLTKIPPGQPLNEKNGERKGDERRDRACEFSNSVHSSNSPQKQAGSGIQKVQCRPWWQFVFVYLVGVLFGRTTLKTNPEVGSVAGRPSVFARGHLLMTDSQ